jgi:uncharacterized lipoprotein YbaY
VPEGCHTRARAATVGPDYDRDVTNDPTRPSVLAVPVTVTIPERVGLGGGAVVTVKLVDSKSEVLAATSVETTSMPVEITLQVDVADVRNPQRLFLWGKLNSTVGVWGTVELKKVRDDESELVLTRVDGAGD